MKNTLKKLHWQEVMIGAVSILITGFGLSLWAVHQHNDILTTIGLCIMGGVCISWWFWVMVVIRTMLKFNDKTTESLEEFCERITEIKEIVQAEINTKR